MIESDNPPIPKPRYDLSTEELEAREQELVGELQERFGEEENLYAVWLSNDSKYADILRTQEHYYWTTMEDIMARHEEQSLFLAMVDTRDRRNQVVHGFRISGTGVAEKTGMGQEVADKDPGSTGIVLIDDIIHSDQGLTAEEFWRYYEERGFDNTRFISVETNFRRPELGHERIPRYNGLPVTQAGYLALFEMVDQGNLYTGETAVFASVNSKTKVSLGLIGAEFEPLMGRDDLKTPVEDGKFDSDYTPIAIPTNAKNLHTFRSLTELAAPSVYL